MDDFTSPHRRHLRERRKIIDAVPDPIHTTTNTGGLEDSSGGGIG